METEKIQLNWAPHYFYEPTPEKERVENQQKQNYKNNKTSEASNFWQDYDVFMNLKRVVYAI